MHIPLTLCPQRAGLDVGLMEFLKSVMYMYLFFYHKLFKTLKSMLVYPLFCYLPIQV